MPFCRCDELAVELLGEPTSFGVSTQPTNGYAARRVNAGRDSRFLRIAATCGLAVPLTNTIGWAVGGLVQPEA